MTAIGWTCDRIQGGSACTGNRSETRRSTSNEVEPLPMTIAARAVSVGTPEPASIRSTSSRDAMCSDSAASGPGGTRPER